ncbi:(deoxy)nucleoside triphosphate pyrophosphohydrolase [bacterium]|nr:(deoxy)nucleoside triphosphate pyrophosphohydrolase [bacterium]
MKIIEVVAAVIIKNGKILCTQRGYNRVDYVSFKYEFPGGKIEIGETQEEALKREIQEELKIDIEILKKYITVEHSYPDFKIIMHSFICKTYSAEPELTEHINSVWLEKNYLTTLDWAPADLPIVLKLVTEEF